jgi:hypothetical protein
VKQLKKPRLYGRPTDELHAAALAAGRKGETLGQLVVTAVAAEVARRKNLRKVPDEWRYVPPGAGSHQKQRIEKHAGIKPKSRRVD